MTKPIFSRDNVETELTRLIIYECKKHFDNNDSVDQETLDSFIDLYLRTAIRRAISNYMRKSKESALALACKCQDEKSRGELIQLLMKDAKKRLSGH